MADPKYRWNCPGERLLDRIEQAGEDELLAFARAMAPELDSDTIQDLFQNEMDADGYFKPLRKRRGAGR